MLPLRPCARTVASNFCRPFIEFFFVIRRSNSLPPSLPLRLKTRSPSPLPHAEGGCQRKSPPGSPSLGSAGLKSRLTRVTGNIPGIPAFHPTPTDSKALRSVTWIAAAAPTVRYTSVGRSVGHVERRAWFSYFVLAFFFLFFFEIELSCCERCV